MPDRLILNMPDVIETPRLILRTPRPRDGLLLNSAYHESRSRLERWFLWAQKDMTVDEHEILMRQKHADYISQDDFMLIITERKSNTLIGGSGLHFRKRDPLIFEIGYWLRTGFEGNGYVSETVRAIVRVGFEMLKAEKIMLRADSENDRSKAVAERNRFTFDGIMRHFEPQHNNPEKMIDMCFYSLLPDEYESLKKDWWDMGEKA